MKRVINFCFLLILSSQVYAVTPSLDAPNLVKVTDKVFALIGDMDVPNKVNKGFISNSIFVITASSVVVIDPGGSKQIGEMLLKEIRKKTTLPVSHVINTHHHADHWLGNHAFNTHQFAPKIIGHPYMIEKATEIGERWIGIISNMTDGANTGTKVVLPGTQFTGQEKLNIGGLNFLFLHPEHAHTKGDLAIVIEEEKVLITGDILFFKRTPGFQDASPTGNRKILDEMMTLDIRHVIPGHGPVTDKTGIAYMLKYLNILHTEVKKYFEDGLQDYEMKDKLDVGSYREMSGFKERFGTNVNRMYLEIEQQAF